MKRDSEGFPIGPWELDSRTAQAVADEVERLREEKMKAVSRNAPGRKVSDSHHGHLGAGGGS